MGSVRETDPQFVNRKRPWVLPEFATPEGIVGVGGDLRPAPLLEAYAHGIFPWFNPGDPIIWWSPDPRAIFELKNFHIPRRLAATIKQNKFRITVDTQFRAVMEGCAAEREEGTWITEEMLEAYTELHRLGHAHSLEVWLGDELAGGIYGIAIGGFFAGESMFHRVRDASKVALISLLTRLRDRGFELFDTQIANDHTAQFGAVEIPRTEYLERLAIAVRKPVEFA
jgi:leucyl/phenylalanyl-tRNA--protein transferase